MKAASRRIRQPEKAEQQRIAQYLAALGSKVYTLGVHRRAGDFMGTMQTPGLPDIVAFVPDRWRRNNGDTAATLFLVVEVKVEGNTLSDPQKDFREWCEAAGVAHVAGGLDDVIDWLLRVGVIELKNVPFYRRPATAAPTKEAGPHAK